MVRHMEATPDSVDAAPEPEPAPDTGARRLQAGYVLFLVAASAFVRLPALHQPLDRDMAGYGTMGWRLLHGDVPYRDLFEQKQPLVYPVYGFFHLLSEHHTEVMRVAAMLAAAATAVVLYFLVARSFGRIAAMAASALFVVAGASSHVEGFDLNTEHILAPLTAAAVLLSLRHRDSTWRWTSVLLGVLAGATVLAKVVGVFTAPAVLLPLVLAAPDTATRLRRTLAFAAGAAAPLLAVCAVFAALGALDDMIDTTIRFNLAYNAGAYQPGGVDPLHERLIGFTATPPGVMVAVALAVGLVHFAVQKRTRLATGTILLWAVGAWVGAQYGVSGFAHYYVPVLAPAAALLAVPLAAPLAAAVRRATPVAWGVAAAQACLAVAVAAPFATNVASFVGQRPVEIAVRVYGDQAYVWNDYETVGRAMKEAAPPGARAMVWGAESGFYWFSGVPPATRYFFDYPLWIDETRVLEQQRLLCERPPELVVLPVDYDWTGYPWAPDIALRADHYELVVDLNGTRVFRLVGDGRQPACDRL